MPHIRQSLRPPYKEVLMQLPPIATKGDLEFCISVLQMIFMATRTYTYSDLHDMVYATIHAGEEAKRNFLDKRENEAMDLNGSAYAGISDEWKCTQRSKESS